MNQDRSTDKVSDGEKAFETWWQNWRQANGYPNTERMRDAARAVYESLAYSNIDAAFEKLKAQGHISTPPSAEAARNDLVSDLAYCEGFLSEAAQDFGPAWVDVHAKVKRVLDAISRTPVSASGERDAVIEECAKFIEAEANSCLPGSAADDQNWGFCLQSAATQMRRSLKHAVGPTGVKP